MGLIEKWNKFAKKTIYINETLEFTAGRGIYTLLKRLGIVIALISVGAPWWAIPLVLIGKYGVKSKKNGSKSTA